MSNKVGFVLSLIFLLHAILFCLDLLLYQTSYTKMELIAVNFQSMVSRDLSLNNAKEYLAKSGATLECRTCIYFNDSGEYKCYIAIACPSISKGQYFEYKLTMNYQPIVIYNTSKTLKTVKAFFI